MKEFLIGYGVLATVVPLAYALAAYLTYLSH